MSDRNITLAIAAAEKSDFKYKVGCSIPVDLSVASWVTGHNLRKTHPMQEKFAHRVGDPHKQYLHAEIHALVKLVKHGYSHLGHAFIVRVGKDGKLRMARPCAICMMALREAGIETIYYSNSDGDIVKETI